MIEGNPGSTGWAAFEARMRNRRFSRCIERATGGLQTGAMEEVRDALDEARMLCPDAPEIAELESRIAALPSPSAVMFASNMSVQEPPAGWLRVIGAMCVLVLLFGLFGFGLAQLYFNAPTALLTDAGPALAPPAVTQAPAVTQPPPAVTSDEPRDARPSAENAAPAAAPQVPQVESPVAQAPATIPAPPRDEPRREPAASAPDSRAIGTSSAPTREERLTRADTPRDEPARRALATSRLETPSRPLPAITEPERWTHPPDSATPAAVPAVSRPEPTPITDPVLPLESPVLSSSAAPPRAVPASTASAPREPALSGPVDSSAEIRMLLSRYETAFNRLDAAAASSVYPSVDRAALDRAFKGLVSQRVSLGLCDITVVGDIGGASCAGKARWEPRVGGGLQTADRYWTFNLRRSTEGWRIEQIRVR
jgi:hypothetical protein